LRGPPPRTDHRAGGIAPSATWELTSGILTQSHSRRTVTHRWPVSDSARPGRPRRGCRSPALRAPVRAVFALGRPRSTCRSTWQTALPGWWTA
jgi:hypothetical protein